jgi:hypothetical protein
MSMSAEINPWTDERVALLKQLCGESDSYLAISRLINDETGARFTRSAVMGKALRLGLEKRAAPRAQANEAAPKKKPDPRPRLTLVKKPDEVPYDFLGLTFEQLPANGCRYPRGGDNPGEPIFFCGQTVVPTLSWCRNCCNIVFERPGSRAVANQRPTQQRVFG